MLQPKSEEDSMEAKTGNSSLAGGDSELRERAIRQLKRKREFVTTLEEGPTEHQIEHEMTRMRNR
jgi:hypothetical protein